MTFHATGRFHCDGCKVVESNERGMTRDDGERPPLPTAWLRIEATDASHFAPTIAVSHYCQHCAPLILSYLQGRRTDLTPED